MFRCGADWYREGEARAVAALYYRAIHCALQAHPELRRYRTRCRDCGILFIADARNRGRTDLRCPFGCRQAHRRQSSTRRSVEYYRSPEGRFKKKMHNGRRASRSGHPQAALDERLSGPEAARVALDDTALKHLQSVTTLIEGRPVLVGEILAVLRKRMRQHSIGKGRKARYPDNRTRGSPV